DCPPPCARHGAPLWFDGVRAMSTRRPPPLTKATGRAARMFLRPQPRPAASRAWRGSARPAPRPRASQPIDTGDTLAGEVGGGLDPGARALSVAALGSME